MESLPGDLDTTVRLRGHHLLCVFGYQGMGYDAAFIEAMSGIVRKLQQDSTVVEVTVGLDELCAACPHRTRERCADPGNARDRAVLTAIGLKPGHREAVTTLFSRVTARISGELFTALCAHCSWYEYGVCASGLATGRIAANWQDVT